MSATSKMTCVCGHEKHAESEPTVCCTIDCDCEKYVDATVDMQVTQNWDVYVNEMKTVKEKVAWVLTNLKYTRNLPNKRFTDFFRSHVTNCDPETVRRTKQKLVEEDNERFGPFDADDFIQQKAFKQLGIEEWITS